MNKKMILIFVLVAFLLSCAGCYNLKEVNRKIESVYANLKKVEIGMSETVDVRSIFPKDQICEVTEYRAEGYISRTYYVGYKSTDPGDFYPTCNWIAAIDCMNGKVTSIFYF
jgi:hypothetical protein